jgi:hypothetical protein
MFHSMRNTLESGTASSRTAAEALRRRLPSGWTIDLRPGGNDEDHLVFKAPDGRSAQLKVVSRRQIVPKDIAYLLRNDREPENRLYVAPFLGARARELLANAAASYADETGNMRVVLSNPAVCA